jgi:hypothetical protein
MENRQWSKSEKIIARRAFDLAHEREYAAVVDEVRRLVNNTAVPVNIWRIEEFLTRQRREMDRKYDYRYSMLSLVFARLIREGWMKESDLAGLGEDKLDEIRRIAGLSKE